MHQEEPQVNHELGLMLSNELLRLLLKSGFTQYVCKTREMYILNLF